MCFTELALQGPQNAAPATKTALQGPQSAKAQLSLKTSGDF